MTEKISTSTCEHCEVFNKSILCSLRTEELSVINLEKSMNHYLKNQNVFQEGNRPHGLYCIHSGKIKITKRGYNGKHQIIRLAKEGDVLGYRALVSGENYSASAETLEDASICFIPKGVIFGLLHKNADLLIQLVQLLSSDLKLAEQKVAEFSQKPVHERIAETLLIIKETYGLESDESTLNIAMSREDLANIAGTATETLIRVLSDFRTKGLIELTGKKIRILKPEDLIRMAAIED